MKGQLTPMATVWLRIWDILVWILFFFPLLTGGIWGEIWLGNSHLKGELAEVGIPVLLLSVLAWVLYAKLQVPLANASSVRSSLWLWKKWENALQAHPKRTLVAATLGVGFLEACVAVRRHWAFGSGAADLGIFTNAIWNLTHGHGYISSVKDGMNLFADHQSPLFWLFAPIFKLFPHVETLLIIQSFGLATAGAALYPLGLQYLTTHLSSIALAALPWLYWAYLPMRNANSFDFHPEVLILPLMLWAIVGLQSQSARSRIWGLLALLLGLGAKESAPVVLVGMGIAWALGAGPPATHAFTRKLGGAIIPVGIIVFLFDTGWVPAWFGRTYAYQAHYEQFGPGLKGIFLAPLTHPKLLLTQLLGPARLRFLFWTLAPLAFLPLFYGRACIQAIPAYAILFLSSGDHRVNWIYHYAAEPSVGLFWALPMGIRNFWALNFSPHGKAFWLLFWVLAGLGRSEIYRLRNYAPTTHHQWLATQLIPSIPPSATVSASGALVPHLADRHWVHHLPNLDIPHGIKGITDTLPTAQVDCAIIDLSVNNWPLPWEQVLKMREILIQRGYALDYHCGSVSVFRNAGPNTRCLRSPPPCSEG